MTNIAIVLGKRINNNGSMNFAMLERLNLLLKLSEEVKLDKVILSGGKGNLLVNMSEAEMMNEYLLKKGFDKEKIILETKSKTTYENAKFCKPIVLEEKPATIYLVTSKNHIKRKIFGASSIFKERFKDFKDITIINYCK